MVNGGGTKVRARAVRRVLGREWVRGGPDEVCLVRASGGTRVITLS